MKLGRPLHLVLVALQLACACQRRNTQNISENASGPRRGDLVVVEASAAQFYEARVINTDHQRVQVQAVAEGSLNWVPSGSVYIISRDKTLTLDRAFGICNVEQAVWVGCKVVQKASSSLLQLRDLRDQTHQLPTSRILAPGPLTELNLRRAFEKTSEQNDFILDLKNAGAPQTMPNWRPYAGRPALVLYEGKWQLSTITGEHSGQMRVRLASGRYEIEVERGTLTAEPPYPLELLKKSHFALLRPNRVSDEWRVVRLVSSDTLEVVVEDYEHGRRNVPVRDVCPLQSIQGEPP